MSVLVPIVEGDGEVDAVPILIRRLLERKQIWNLRVARPKNAHGCSNLTKTGGLEKFVELAYRERDCAGVLVLMDADNAVDCPVRLAGEFRQRILTYGVKHPVALVFARREYEAWFLASLPSISGNDLDGRPGLPEGLVFEGDVEEIRGVKGWIGRNILDGRTYKETEDQAPMTSRIDIDLVIERSRSFRRFVHAVDELTLAMANGTVSVSPEVPLA